MKCQICFNNYSHTDHKPYVLIPCTHTLCIRCLDDITDEPKECPICSQTIKGRNPNWALLDLIPDTQVDNHKFQLQKSLNETDDLKKKLSHLKKLSYKETISNLKQVREEIIQQTDILIDQLRQNQARLLGDTKTIEANLEADRLNQIKMDQQLDVKLKETRRRLVKNDLNENQLNTLRSYFARLNLDLNTKFNEKIDIKTEFKFVPNDSFSIQKDSIGRIQNVYALNNHEKLIHNKLIKYLDEKKYDSALEIVNKSLETNATCAQCYNYKGLTLSCLNDHVEALNCFNRSIELDTTNADVFTNKANVLKELKDFNGAIKCYSIGLNNNKFTFLKS